MILRAPNAIESTFYFSPVDGTQNNNTARTRMLHTARTIRRNKRTKHSEVEAEERKLLLGHFPPSLRFQPIRRADVVGGFWGEFPCFRLCKNISINSVEFFVLVGRRFSCRSRKNFFFVSVIEVRS